MFGAIVILVGAFVLTGMDDPIPEVIQVRRVEVLNDEGRVVVSLHSQLRFEGNPGDFAGKIHFIGSTGEIVERVGRCRALGISHLILNCFYSDLSRLVFASLDDTLRTIERFAEEVLPRVGD